MKKKKTYQPGFRPAGEIAWCAYHQRGMNAKYMRKKQCIFRGPCKHLRWNKEEESCKASE